MDPGSLRDPPARRCGGAGLSLLLFDTTFLVDAERASVDLDEIVDDEDDIAVAAITVAELKVGVELAKGRAKAARGRFLEEVLAAVPVLYYDLRVAEAHALLLIAVRKAGRPRGAHDLIIAATALATRRTVVTADPAGFADLPGLATKTHR
jgi:tRNA(fMet)-specific endonuclease VapC